MGNNLFNKWGLSDSQLQHTCDLILNKEIYQHARWDIESILPTDYEAMPTDPLIFTLGGEAIENLHYK